MRLLPRIKLQRKMKIKYKKTNKSLLEIKKEEYRQILKECSIKYCFNDLISFIWVLLYYSNFTKTKFKPNHFYNFMLIFN